MLISSIQIIRCNSEDHLRRILWIHANCVFRSPTDTLALLSSYNCGQTIFFIHNRWEGDHESSNALIKVIININANTPIGTCPIITAPMLNNLSPLLLTMAFHTACKSAAPITAMKTVVVISVLLQKTRFSPAQWQAHSRQHSDPVLCWVHWTGKVKWATQN